MSGEYRCVRTRGELTELVAELRAATVVAVDTETTGLSPLRAELCGIALSVKAGTGVYVPVRSPERSEHLDPPTVLEALRPVLEDARIAKVGHNLKVDLLVLRRAGVELRGVGCWGEVGRGREALAMPPSTGEAAIGFDSMVASYLIDASRSSHSLDALCLALLGRTNTSLRDLIGSGAKEKSFDCVPLHLAAPYAAEDVDAALQLREVMLPQLKAMGLMPLFRDVEMPLVEVLAELEWHGITVDPDELERQRERLAERLRQLRGEIDDAAYGTLGRTFNPDSPLQLRAVLFNKPDDVEPGLGIKPLKRTKTGHSTDIEVLEKLAADVTIETPIPKLIVEHRQLSKLVGTYLEALKGEIHPETGRIHASFNQTVAATGRLSSSDPNLQNIPIRTEIGREIRKAFVAAPPPPPHVLISADYSQIELRLLAHLSRDPALIEAFHQGRDIHRAVAAQIHGVKPEEVTREQRDGAKMVNFGIVYGITAFGLARRLGIGEREAGQIITGYKKRFAGITTFLQECVDFARRYGYVETMLKRRRPIPEIEARNPARRSLAERMAINSVVQGSAADLIKLAMVELHGVFGGACSNGTQGVNDAPSIEPQRTQSTQRNAQRGEENKDPLERGTALSGPLSVFSVSSVVQKEKGPIWRGPPVKMLLQIHDELVFEAPESVAEEVRGVIVARMEGAMQIDVPLVVESSVSRDWFGGKG
jgi:DNA polymerase-1